MIYGYVRISTATQSMERQIRNIKAVYPTAIIIQEVFTRTSFNRKEWQKLFGKVKAGDIIVFDSVSRMSGNAEDGFNAYEELYNRGVELVFLKEPHINTATYKKALEKHVSLTGTSVDYILEGINKYLMALAKEQIIIAFEQSEKEVSDLRQRTKEGIETARINGKQIGAVKGSTYNVKKETVAKKKISELSNSFSGTLSDADCIKLIGISRNTYYKYKRELKNE